MSRKLPRKLPRMITGSLDLWLQDLVATDFHYPEPYAVQAHGASLGPRGVGNTRVISPCVVIGNWLAQGESGETSSLHGQTNHEARSAKLRSARCRWPNQRRRLTLSPSVSVQPPRFLPSLSCVG